MRIVRNILALFVLLCASTGFLSGVLARYTSVNAGSDTALVAKWNFSVAEFGDTFSLFDGTLAPQASGSQTITLNSGGSDTALDYELLMNADTFKDLSGMDDAPLVFRVTAESATVHITGWFSLNALSGNTRVVSGRFPVSSTADEEITVEWWWNTSFFVTPINGLTADDTATAPDYYAKAVTSYAEAESALRSAIAAEESYATHYRFHPGGTRTDSEGNVSVIPAYYAWDGGYSDAGYENMQNATALKQTTVMQHTKRRYDAYDTALSNAVANAHNTPKVTFVVNGEQVMPTAA